MVLEITFFLKTQSEERKGEGRKEKEAGENVSKNARGREESNQEITRRC